MPEASFAREIPLGITDARDGKLPARHLSAAFSASVDELLRSITA
jgi:hypothetical protein